MDRRRAASLLLSIGIPCLTEAGILAAPLTSGPTKWQGIAHLPDEDGRLPAKNGRCCRLDLTYALRPYRVGMRVDFNNFVA